MTVVYLGLGSNIEREQHLAAALIALQQRFGDVACSLVYESKSLSGVDATYFNAVVMLQTDFPVGELKAVLRAIEHERGRLRDGSGRCHLDIDILLYGACAGVVDGVTLPHPDVLTRAYVLRPLAELAPDQVHPVAQKSLRELWQSFAGCCDLNAVSFSSDSILHPLQ